MGFQTEGRQPSADGGIDIVAVSSQPLVSGRYIIQCKRYSHPVSSPIIRDLYGVVNATNSNKGILITTSTFTSDAIDFSKDKQIELIDGTRLIDLLQKYSLLVSVEERANPRLLASGMLRNELSLQREKFEKSFIDIEHNSNLFGSKSFGGNYERRTYVKYTHFFPESLNKFNQATNATFQIATGAKNFIHSSDPQPERAREISKQFEELCQFWLSLYRSMKESTAPTPFTQSHTMLRELIRSDARDFGNFLKQLEETLEKATGLVNYDIRTQGTTEIVSLYEDALKRVNKGKPWIRRPNNIWFKKPW
jgi:Restriction endonuclease